MSVSGIGKFLRKLSMKSVRIGNNNSLVNCIKREILVILIIDFQIMTCRAASNLGASSKEEVKQFLDSVDTILTDCDGMLNYFLLCIIPSLLTWLSIIFIMQIACDI